MNSRQNKILIVDDREENIFSLENMLEKEDRIFLRALSGHEALKIVFKENDISLILLDVQMPGMDGFETASFLKTNSRTRKIPIIFVTAISKERKFLLKGLSGGAVDYLFKPLDTEITRAKVSTLLQLFSQQQELELMNNELQRLNEEKNRLLGIAAHDLRSPLSGIMMLSDHVLSDTEDPLSSDHKEIMELINSSSTYMLRLVNNLLDVAKIEAGRIDLKLKRLDIITLVDKCIKFNKIQADKKNIKFTYAPALEELYLHVDAEQMQQVFNNLISNALKFSQEHTEIKIAVSEALNFAQISLIDQGQGIAEKDLGKLFSFFSKTSTQATAGEKSTGLGLAISKKIAEAHQGFITVESEFGVGSVFTVNIPVPSATTVVEE